MADTKISGLTSATPVDADYVAGVDVSDTTQSPGGSTARFLFSAIWGYISGKLGALATKSTVATADIADGAVTYAKMQNAATGASVVAKIAAGAGAYGELAAATNTVLRRVGGDLGFGLLSKVHLNVNIVDNTILSQVASQTIKGRTTAGTGNCEDLTAAQVTAMLDAFTSTLKGLVPASGGGTTNFLRADGTWAAPAGGGSTGTTYFNGTGGTLAKGTPVCLAAFDAGSGNPGMAAADADGAGLMPCIGILGAAVSAGASGIPVITGGEITGLDTSAWALGDRLYVSTGGVLTKVRPTAGFIQSVAVVSRVDPVAGEIIVAIEEAGELYTEVLERAISDETTDLTTGTAKLTFRMPFGFVLTGIRASVNTAPVGAAIQVDVNEGGVSIFSTPLTIDAGEKTSVTAATPAVISDATLADDAEITVDIDAVGSTTAGKGLKIVMLGYRA